MGAGSVPEDPAYRTSELPDHHIVLTYDPDGTLVDRVRAALPHRSLEIVRELTADEVPSAMPGTTIFFGNYLAPSALRQAGALRWIQTVGAGVDVLLSVDLADARTSSSRIPAGRLAPRSPSTRYRSCSPWPVDCPPRCGRSRPGAMRPNPATTCSSWPARLLASWASATSDKRWRGARMGLACG